MRPMPISGWPTRWPARPMPSRKLTDEVWTAAKRKAAQRSRGAVAHRARRRHQPAGAMGLAVLRRKTAAIRLCHRRSRGEAVFRAGEHAARRLRHGHAPVRPHLRRAARPARLPPRRPRLRGPRQGARPARADRHFPRRSLRPPRQALGRLDEQLSRPGNAGRRRSRRSSSTTTISPAPRRRCSVSTMPRRCSTNSATRCTAC